MEIIPVGMGVMFWILFMLFIVLLPLIALVSIIGNRFAPNVKLLWILVILCIPFIGSVLYFTVGRKHRIR